MQDSLDFVSGQTHDVIFDVNQAIPLLIKNGYLLSFSITSVDGKFNKDNFILVICAVRRNSKASQDIVYIGWRNKVFEDMQAKNVLNQLLTEQEISALFAKFRIWMGQIS